MYDCTEERFLSDIKEHSLEVLHDDGVYRHLKFTNNGSQNFRFDLTTWPGYLCISGDMGTYTFQRTTDMFEFFRTDKNDFNYNKTGLSINARYWAEKLESEKRDNKGREFDESLILPSIIEHATQYCSDIDYEECTNPETDEKFNSNEELLEFYLNEIREHFKYVEMDEYRFCRAVDDFESEIHADFNFTDEWEWIETHKYTFHYIWCLYAIAYGVEQYDKL